MVDATPAIVPGVVKNPDADSYAKQPRKSRVEKEVKEWGFSSTGRKEESQLIKWRKRRQRLHAPSPFDRG